MQSKYVEQGLEIERICSEAGLTPDAMAARVALKTESMRKILKGYQPCSEQLMQSMRNVVEMERMRRGESPAQPITDARFIEATRQLREIAEADPAKLQEIAQIITTYRGTLPKRKGMRGISSKVVDALAKSAGSDADVARRRRPKSSP